jgi:hypothetical protein
LSSERYYYHILCFPQNSALKGKISYQLGHPNSFEVVDENTFTICDNSKLLLYDYPWKQIGHIGNYDRSNNEYLQLVIVRYNEGAIMLCMERFDNSIKKNNYIHIWK